ncbi:MAG: ATP:cob(I)alamin adenosyltransferase, partial [Candidatus Krumholzibacteriota bacterium]|nr:ATP:cob(I)alamin adenosyltransferase [Candidatus Krumholzibacteriota bacterium]
LHLVASMLACPAPVELAVAPLPASAAAELEAWIDAMDEELPPLDHFILPGGGRLGAELHRARTVCRRAERHVVALSRHADVPAPVRVYLNRLSDFLFTAARLANRREGLEEEAWPGE